MKILIEGPDRVGKDTLIANIRNHFIDIPFFTMHSSVIKSTDTAKVVENFRKSNVEFFKLLQTDFNIIFNRTHLGEMVYGPMYRNSNGEYIYELEDKYNTDDCYLILLYDDPQTLFKRADGLSISSKLQDIEKEIQLFNIAFDRSSIKNKIRVKCNKSTADVFNDVLNFIG